MILDSVGVKLDEVNLSDMVVSGVIFPEFTWLVPIDSRMSLTLRKQELSSHPREDSPEAFWNLWRPKELILGRRKKMEDLKISFIDRSERYFESVRYSRAAVPASYSSVDLGLVSPVKNQVRITFY